MWPSDIEALLAQEGVTMFVDAGFTDIDECNAATLRAVRCGSDT
jgi:hypothetical protein